MPTTHFRSGSHTVVLTESPAAVIPAVVAELAEVLVASQLATQNDVAQLRLAIETDSGVWQDVTESNESLESLGVANNTIIAYKFGDDSEFSYEPYATE